MFAVELLFNDGISPDELIIVRRQSFVLGSMQDADVILEGASGVISPLRIERRRGRRFLAIPLEDEALPQLFSGEAELQIGEITLRIIPLDIDLVIASLGSNEFAASKVLSRALCNGPPEYPAIEIIGSSNCIVSFPKESEILIGRSRNCLIRLDDEGVHQEHVKFAAFGQGQSLHEFWLEPIPGADCFFQANEPIIGRVNLVSGQSVILSPGKCSIRFLLEEDPSIDPFDKPKKPSVIISRYPCIVSRSDLMKPERYPLSLGRRISLGRDPSNEIWFNAEHISRLHAEIVLDSDPVKQENSRVYITDFSSNGTYIEGVRLPNEVRRTLQDKLTVVDLSKGITFAICYTAEEEEEYLGRKPKIQKRASSLHGQILSQIQIPLTPFNSDEESSNISDRPNWFSSSQLKSETQNNSSIESAQSEAFVPLLSSDSSEPLRKQSSGFERPEEESSESNSLSVDDFAPAKRFGLLGQIVFYGAVLFLILLNYFLYFGR